MKRRKTFAPILEVITEDGKNPLSLTTFDKAMIAEFAGLSAFWFI
jgi:hypothetical protein